MKKILFTLLAVICLLNVASACTPANSVDPSPSVTIQPSPSASAAPNEATSVSDFTIIYSEEDYNSYSATVDLSISLYGYGIKLPICSDSPDESPDIGETEYEILIGNTNRTESELTMEKIVPRKNDYFIKFVNNKIVINAGSKDSLKDAVNYFAELCSKDNTFDTLKALDIISRYGNSPDGFFIDGISIDDFSIISSDSEINNEIIDKIYKATGYTLSFGDIDTPTEHEIIIGNVARDEVSAVKDDLRDLDYAVKIINGKIVILGGTNALTKNAYDLFVSEFLDTKENKKEFTSQKDDIVYRHDYPVSSIKLLGYNISEYVILAQKENDRAATVIQEYINNLTGIKIDIVTNGNPQKAIILGNVGTRQYKELTVNLKNDEYIIKTVGTRVYLGTVDNEDYYSDGPAVHKFIEDYLGYNLTTGTLASNTVEINDIDDVAKIDDYLMKVASEDFLAQIDAKAEALKNSIVNSTTDITYTGTAYYVSNDGNDENDGLTPKTAWATLDRVTNASELKFGDAVLFNRGDIFRGHLGTVEGVTYSAYGEGVKPRIWGSPVDGAKEYEWIKVAPDVWKYTYYFGSTDIGTVVLNHGEKIGIKICPDYSQRPVLNDVTKEPLSYKTMNTVDLYFYCSTVFRYNGLIDTDYGYLYMSCKAGNPGEVFDSIEFNIQGNIIDGAAYSTFDNLWVQYGGSHGINVGNDHCTVQNCEVSYIGGCYQGDGDGVRYGNGIELFGSGNDFTVRDSYVHHCYDAGITNQGGSSYSNIYYYNNLLEYSIYNIEYWNGGNAETNAPTTNMYIHDNIMRNAVCPFDPNRADGFNGFHIAASGYCEQIDCGVYNNIFMYSHKWLIRNVCSTDESWLLPYYDNIFIEYEGGYVGSAANTTGNKHGVYSTFDYSGIDSHEYRKNTFYVVKK